MLKNSVIWKNKRTLKILGLLAVLAISYGQPAHAGTTTADFLKWERASQISFLQTAISMAATIAAQIDPKMAGCINDWYYAKKALQEKRHAELTGLMPQYAKFHPTTVVLAFVENACGKFGKS